jgi:hypothetical protein
MSTATMSRTDATGRIRQLMDEFDQFEQEVDVKRKQFQTDLQTANEALFGQPSNGQAPTVLTQRTTGNTGKRVGRPAQKPPARAAAAGTGSDNRLKGGNQMSLRRAIWHVLDRNPKKWEELLPELPKKAEGLNVAEIREIIEKEKLWTGENIALPTLLSRLYAQERWPRRTHRRRALFHSRGR